MPRFSQIEGLSLPQGETLDSSRVQIEFLKSRCFPISCSHSSHRSIKAPLFKKSLFFVSNKEDTWSPLRRLLSWKCRNWSDNWKALFRNRESFSQSLKKFFLLKVWLLWWTTTRKTEPQKLTRITSLSRELSHSTQMTNIRYAKLYLCSRSLKMCNILCACVAQSVRGTPRAKVAVSVP